MVLRLHWAFHVQRYYETLHMPDDEPVAEVPVDWSFDKLGPKIFSESTGLAGQSSFGPCIEP